MIKLSKELAERMIQQATEHLPIECCGVLAGQNDGLIIEVVEIYPMRNVDQSPEYFSLDPQEQFKVYYQIRDRGLKLLGNYHSHPLTPARPSTEDIRLAYDPEAVYMILSLAGTEPVLKAFHIRDGKATEIQMQVT